MNHGRYFIDCVLDFSGIKNDSALSRKTGMQQSSISAIRRGKYIVSAGTIIRFHEATGLSIKALQLLAAGKRAEAEECI